MPQLAEIAQASQTEVMAVIAQGAKVSIRAATDVFTRK